MTGGCRHSKKNEGRPPTPAGNLLPAGGVFSTAVQVPRRLLQPEVASGASPLSGRSAEEAGSRPFCGLVLCNFLLYQVGSLNARDHVLPLRIRGPLDWGAWSAPLSTFNMHPRSPAVKHWRRVSAGFKRQPKTIGVVRAALPLSTETHPSAVSVAGILCRPPSRTASAGPGRRIQR